MFIPKVIYLFIILGAAFIGIVNIAMFISMVVMDHKKSKQKKDTPIPKNEIE